MPYKVLFIVLLLLFVHDSVYAHRMLVEKLDSELVQVRYDDGTTASLALVSGYDKHGTLLFEKKVNEDGIVRVDNTLVLHRIVADDGMGHRAVLVEGAKETLVESIPKWMRALLGASFLLFVASLFYYRLDKRTNTEVQ